MSKKWNFIKAEDIYIYPSANADDGGDVNSEFNVSDLTSHLTQKNFVVREVKDVVDAFTYLRNINPITYTLTGTPFYIDRFTVIVNGNETSNYIYDSDTNTIIIQETPNIGSIVYIKYKGRTNPINVVKTGTKFGITSGMIVLDGKHITFNGTNIASQIEINTSYISNLSSFIRSFNTIYPLWYDTLTGKKKTFPKGKEPKTPVPLLHIVFKLLKNTTGNVRGDLLELNSETLTQVLNCKGVAWSILTDQEVAALTVPYLDIATIMIKYNTPSSATSVEVSEVINLPNKYSYIDINSIYENETPLGTYLDERFDIANKTFDKITYYKTVRDTVLQEDVQMKVKEITFDNNGNAFIKAFDAIEPYSYNEDGTVVVTQKTGYDESYSIERIQKRTHVASANNTQELSPEEILDSDLAPTIDNRDLGDGTIECAFTTGTSTLTENGHSRLLARADHNHDSRYIRTEDGYSDNTKTQKIGTNLTVSGNINASRVYNAVWNDSAELYKKEYPYEQYDEGTVICKVPGKNTYDFSSFENRKLVVGVVTNSYGHLLGGDKNLSLEENLQKYMPISLSGRVPVKVTKGVEISEGDLLVVSSVKGIATVVSCPERGTIIGKALESSDGSKDKVLMQVMLN